MGVIFISDFWNVVNRATQFPISLKFFLDIISRFLRKCIRFCFAELKVSESWMTQRTSSLNDGLNIFQLRTNNHRQYYVCGIYSYVKTDLMKYSVTEWLMESWRTKTCILIWILCERTDGSERKEVIQPTNTVQFQWCSTVPFLLMFVIASLGCLTSNLRSFKAIWWGAKVMHLWNLRKNLKVS